MVNEMSLRLEKLVEDIKEETILWPIEDAKNSPEEDAAWARIGAKHKMTGPHVKSIFKVLSKKYEVEKANLNSEWKLFGYLSFLDKKKEESIENEAEFDDGEEFVELLEVNEEYCSDDEEPNTSGGSNSENSNKITSSDTLFKSQIHPDIQIRKIRNEKSPMSDKNDTKNGTVKRQLRQQISENGVKPANSTSTPTIKNSQHTMVKSTSPVQKKFVRVPVNVSKNNSNASASEKKTQSTLTNSLKLALKKDDKARQSLPNMKEVKLKRKGDSKNTDREEDETNPPPLKRQIVLSKGVNVVTSSTKKIISKTNVPSTATSEQNQSTSTESLNLMPISPAEKLPPFSSFMKKSPASVSKENENILQVKKGQGQARSNTSTQLQSAKLEKLSPSQQLNLSDNSAASNNKINGVETVKKDFLDKSEAKLEIEQISKDADENTEIKVKVLTEQAEKILPTFFRDLYNSKKYDSFGMYVSSTMNRLSSRLASKLEAKILQSIIEVNAMVDECMDDI